MAATKSGMPSVSPTNPGTPTTQQAWDLLNSDYGTAYNGAIQGGMNDTQWAASPAFQQYQNKVLGAINNTYDTDKLQSDIASFTNQFSDPIYGPNARKLAEAESSRLNFLNSPQTTNPLISALRANSPAPARQAGGIKEYGIADFPWTKNTPDNTKFKDPRDVPVNPVVVNPPVTPPVTPPVVTPPVSPYVAPPAGGTMDSGSWDSLNANYAQDYAKAQGNMTDAEWAATPAFKQYQDQVISGIGQTTDMDKLATDINWFANNMNDPALGDNYRTISAASQKRLDYLKSLNNQNNNQNNDGF
ncbi:hypothetical protein UFOVP1375_15 [uncultured Caudovirales phage]|uniref:Uncharacterized protein n=1 Tax=uncultured Caudovirales phage TaxID=2100421 RepID=A0A6J5QJM2_9CAUD|nr:hypothetical protein UFOVP1107_36 [uncultured Caudovirales phage]CAB4188066.1 hypothetical protein UFOVP1171_51 [uncultured Caudovirales phage]CAB4202486.1 hypothetical protein UFOVP1375_15 [uncultured Caudovirales phage]CAB4214822.1 hypothetical protein UFOVP1471_31 [uncultured Caudovirales phage]